MFDPRGKSTGTLYTATVTLLSGGVFCIPALLLVSRPGGYGLLSLASAASLAFLGFASLSWARSSRLSIPTIDGARTERR